MTEKTIVFGKGYLGTRISEQLGYKVVGREADPLNLHNLKCFLEHEKPSVVINAIGKTGGPGAIGIDWCETHKEETIQANVTAAVNLATECSSRGVYFVHLGSGCIYHGFGPNGNGFTEQDPPNFYGPQFYAKSKILAEQVLAELPGLVLRLRMPIDDRSHPRNLIDKLAAYPKVIGALNSMTTIPHAIPAIKKLIEKRAQGVYNFTNPGLISAKEIMEMYQEIVDPNHKFKVMSLDELNAMTVGRRSNCYLNTAKLKSEGIELPMIQYAVEECLLRYRENLGKGTL